MRHAVNEREQTRKAKPRLRMIEHYEQVSGNVSQTCRFFGLSRTQFYIALRRYREAGVAGLRERPCGPHQSPLRTPPHIEALIPRIREDRQYGTVRLGLFLQRDHQVNLNINIIAARRNNPRIK